MTLALGALIFGGCLRESRRGAPIQEELQAIWKYSAYFLRAFLGSVTSKLSKQMIALQMLGSSAGSELVRSNPTVNTYLARKAAQGRLPSR